MRGIEDFRGSCRVLLGDAAGRRYLDDVLDMGLREALGVFRSFCPRRESMMMTVRSRKGISLVLSGMLDPGTEILTIRDGDGVWLIYGEYRTDTEIMINCYGTGQRVPQPGERLQLQVSPPHRIKGLDDGTVTTVPESQSLILCKGAAGYAMRMRARSVTEVFGKRPEDREALMQQADQMINEFLAELGNFARLESCRRLPWSKGKYY